MRSSKWAALAAGALVVATVTGCSVHPGAAAVVDGRTISEDYLTQASADLGQTDGWTLALLIAAPYFIEVADENGVGVSTVQAREALEASLAEQDAVAAPIGDGAVQVMRMALAMRAISELPGGSEILAETDAMVLALDMDINPRYGEMDPTSGQIAREPLPWIVSSAG